MISENSLNKIEKNNNNIIYIPNQIPEFDVQDYDFFDDKDMAKYITDLERFVRSSYEYKGMISYLREYMNMNSCAFLPNITNENTFKIRIEIHHSPITLYDICQIIFNKRQKNNECLNIEAVAFEVLWVHYSLMVGLIPLSETVHELVHTQYIFVPVDKVYGYYRQFINTYYDYVNPAMLDKLDELETLTIEGNNEQYKEVLEKQYIYIDMGDNSQIEQLHNIQLELKQRMSDLRNNNYNNDFTINHPENNVVVSRVNRSPFIKL